MDFCDLVGIMFGVVDVLLNGCILFKDGIIELFLVIVNIFKIDLF